MGRARLRQPLRLAPADVADMADMAQLADTAEEVGMRVFLGACLVAIILAAGAAFVLNTFVRGSAVTAFSSSGVRV
jgi:hypothetical protein